MKSEEILKELHETRATIKFLQHQTCVLGRKARNLGQEYDKAQREEAKARKEALKAENKEETSSEDLIKELAKKILDAEKVEIRKIGA